MLISFCIYDYVVRSTEGAKLTSILDIEIDSRSVLPTRQTIFKSSRRKPYLFGHIQEFLWIETIIGWSDLINFRCIFPKLTVASELTSTLQCLGFLWSFGV